MVLKKSIKNISKKKLTSKKVIFKPKNKKTYLDYLKNNKYKFFTSGLLISGGLAYIRHNKYKSQELYNKIKNDKELQNNLSDIGSNVIIKVVDNYTKNVIQNIQTVSVNKIQDAIANVVVPKELLENPKLLNQVNTIIIKNVNETTIDANTIRNIEKFLINKGIINENCSKYNSIPGGFPCDDIGKKTTSEIVLKYFADEKLLKEVNEYIIEMLLKHAEKILLDEKKIQDGCTKFNKAWFYSQECKNQKEADKLIEDKLNELLRK